jgi:hypothetical protein
MEEIDMKKTTFRSFGLVFAVVLVAGAVSATSATSATAETFKEHFDHTYPLAASGTFTLKDVNGPVSVTAWDRNEVHVVAEKEVRAGNAEEGKRRLAELKIDASSKPGDLRIDTRFPHQNGGGLFDWLSGNGGSGSVAYKIEVPRNVKVDVETVNGAVSVHGTAGDLKAETTNGAVDVAGVQGKIRLGSTNGAISAEDAAGSVVAETTNGSIEVDLKRVDRGGDMSFETTNGHITLKVPKDIQASISASTTNGHVSTDLPVQLHGKASKHHLDGDVNGGGGKLHLESTNGGIEIHAQR